jgi:hypothetical protein
MLVLDLWLTVCLLNNHFLDVPMISLKGTSESTVVMRICMQILTCVYFGMAGAGCIGRELRVRAIAITGFSADAVLRVAAAV